MARSVGPPSVQRCQWCPWQSQGGQSQPVGDAAAVSHGHGEQLGLGEEPAGAADVEDLRGPVEDDGDDPAGAGQASGKAWADAFAGVEDPGLVEFAGEGVEVDLHDDGGVGAADLGQVLGGDAFDELGERPPHPLRTRTPLHTPPAPWVAAWCLGAAIASSIFFSIAACTVGRVNRPCTFPCPSSVIVSRQCLGGLGLFLLEEIGLVLVGQVGGHHLQQASSEDRSGCGRRARRLRRPGVVRPGSAGRGPGRRGGL